MNDFEIKPGKFRTICRHAALIVAVADDAIVGFVWIGERHWMPIIWDRRAIKSTATRASYRISGPWDLEEPFPSLEGIELLT